MGWEAHTAKEKITLWKVSLAGLRILILKRLRTT